MYFAITLFAFIGTTQALWCCCQNPVPFCDRAGYSQQSCSNIGLSWQESTFSSGCDIGNPSGPNYNNFYNACAQYNLHAKCY